MKIFTFFFAAVIGHIKNELWFLFGVGVLIGLAFATFFGFSYQVFTLDLSRIDWTAVSASATTAMAIFVAIQARATEKMAEHLLPSVDVKMFFNRANGNTRFAFSNGSDKPALISVLATVNNEEAQDVFNRALYIPPSRGTYRLTQWFALLGRQTYTEGDSVLLKIVVNPVFNKTRSEITFEKTYVLHEGQWDEASWGAPDNLL